MTSLRGRRFEGKMRAKGGKTACRKTSSFLIPRPPVNGKYWLVSFLIDDVNYIPKYNKCWISNMSSAKECVAEALETLNVLRGNQQQIILK